MKNFLVAKMSQLSGAHIVAFGVLVAVLVFGGLSVSRPAQAASDTDCDNNAVIFCGVSSVDDLVSKYNNGDGTNSARSIQHIYTWFGISSDDIQSLAGTARNGTVTRDGDVLVDGNIIATGATTAGRQDIQPGSTQHTAQDTTFFSRSPSVSFQSSSLAAYVVIKDGVFQFAILKSCGNPVKAQAKPAPAPTPKPTTQPAPAPAPTPAPQPTPAPSTSVCSGDTTNTNSGGVTSQGGNCSINNTTVVQQTQSQATPPVPPPQTPVTTPAGQCTNLSVTAGHDTSNSLTVVAAVSFSTQGGATLQNITYDFGDASVTPPTTQTTVSHTYQQGGSYVVTATLAFTSSSDVAPATCQANITVAPAPAPAVSTAVATTPAAPAAQVAAAPATQLVNTGPGSVAGIFGLTAVSSMFGYRYYLRRHLQTL
ncbi:MAG TPA: PKD domain-containing protein [Candidatus Saccharimonadales bacterium]